MAAMFSLLFLFVCVTIVQPLDANSALQRALALNDFESGTTSPWNDESAADVRRTIHLWKRINRRRIPFQDSVIFALLDRQGRQVTPF